jgi:hypothetical protein
MSQLQSEMLNSIKSQTPENIFFNQEQKIENVLNQAQGFNPFEV